MTVDNMVGIIAGVLLLLGAVYTISRGKTRWVFKRVDRKRDPQKFWIAVTALIVSGILLLLFNALPAPTVGPY